MKAIFFIFLFVYIVGAAFKVMSVYNEYNNEWKKEEKMQNVYEWISVFVLLGGVIFCLWSVGMWFENMW